MPALNCTTLANVKLLLNSPTADTDPDATLEGMIDAVSQRIERFIGRQLQTGTFTEEYDVQGVDQETLFLRNYPVTSITSIKNDPDWDFANTTAVDSDLYRLFGDTGEVHLRTQLIPGNKSVEVVYAGGFAADTSTLMTNYPDIARACELQVVSMWRRRSSPQGESMSGGYPGGMTHEAPLMLIPEVVETLMPYKRIRFGA